MIIHSPIISGSLTFADGSTLTLPPGSVYSGSFSGSYEGDTFSGGVFTGDGSQLTFNGTGIVSGSSQVEFNDVNNNPFSQSESSVTVEKSIIPSSLTLDLGSVSSPFRDLYLSSASLYIDGTQVISTQTGDLEITTDANQSLRIIEEGADTLTLQTENGDITLTTTGTGNIELNATVQVEAGNKIISSDGNAIVFGDDIDIEGNIIVDGTVDGVDVASFKSSFDTLNGKTLVSGSSQITSLSHLSTTDLSEGTNLYYTDARVKTKLDVEGVISGSSQISLSGFSTTDLSEGTNLYYTDARVKTKLDAEGVISGSSQVVLSTTDVSEGTNLYYTDARVKTKLDAEGVTSGSTHILALVSIDEDNMASNSDTKLPTQQSVKSYVDAEVAALVDSAPGALDTLNELAAALGDDANFSTTISNQIAGKVSQSLEIISGNGLTGGGNLTTNRTLSVGGTTDRISVTADAVDIASTYVGQTSITTLGTIGTGTWQGSVISSAYLDADTAHLSGTQTFSGTKTFSAVTTISNSTASTSTTTGAFKVTGGVGIGGALNVGGDVVAYASSDERLKENIELISNPIQKVQSLKGVTWNWNDNADELQKSLPNVGVIAQDVEKVLPQLVHDRENGFKGVDYAKLTGLLIEAIKEQQKQIDDLKSKLG